MFDHRLRDFKHASNKRNNLVHDHDQERSLLMRNKARRDQKAASDEDIEQTNITGRRLGGGKISNRMRIHNTDGHHQLKLSEIHTERSEKDPAGMKDPNNERRGSMTISDILKKTNADGTNPHLTRSRASIGGALPKVKEPSPLLDDFPDELRYSKNHPMPKWIRPLMYPKTGKKRATVDCQDLERLDEGQFLNDNLISFYLRYFENTLATRGPKSQPSVYFFNTYFFQSVSSTGRGQRGINYDAVKKWTRDVDLFNYDYAVVPINESAHWYVAIICNLPAIKRGLSLPSESPQLSQHEVQHSRVRTRSRTMRDDGAFVSLDAVKLDVEEVGTANSFSELHIHDVKSHDDTLKSTIPDSSLVAIDSEPRALNADSVIQQEDDVSCEQGKGKQERERSPELNGDTADKRASHESIRYITLEENGDKKSKRKSIPPSRSLDADEPAIVTLDSLGLTHPHTVRVLKDYLRAEAADKRGGMVFDEGQIKGMTAKQIPLQDNYCDCGLYLLGYIEKFAESPTEFVARTLQRQYNPDEDFPKLVPSDMRAEIRTLICKLHDEQEAERAGAMRKKQTSLPKITKAEKQTNDAASKTSVLTSLTKQEQIGTMEGSAHMRYSPGQDPVAEHHSTRGKPSESFTSLLPSSVQELSDPSNVAAEPQRRYHDIDCSIVIKDSQSQAPFKQPAKISQQELQQKCLSVADSFEHPAEIPSTPSPTRSRERVSGSTQRFSNLEESALTSRPENRSETGGDIAISPAQRNSSIVLIND